MKLNLLITATALLLVCSPLNAESLPLKSVNKANEVIDAAIEAHGGSEAISNLNSLVQSADFANFAVGQSLKPGEPYDRNSSKNFNAIDFENEIFVTRNSGAGGGYIFDNGTIINGENGSQLNYRGGTSAPIAEPDFDTVSGPFIRVTPALLMKQLQTRRGQSNWLGEAEINGRNHDVITLVMAVGPALALYIDQENHMLTRMERVLPPFGQVGYSFEDYKVVDGIAFNQRFKLFINDDENLVISDIKTEVNVPVEQYTQLSPNIREVAVITPDPMSTNEVKEGVYLIGGNGTYAMFVEMDDYVVAVGGTQIVAAAVEEMRKEIADKPIRYGVLTHHHNDHVPGAAVYAAEGATIVTFEENETVVRAAAGDDEENQATLEFVDGKKTLSDGNRVIELYNIGPTPHVENLLIAYLPEYGIVFEADHFPQPLNGVAPPVNPVTVAFAKSLDELGLDYKIILGAHTPRVGTPADLKKALDTKPASL